MSKILTALFLIIGFIQTPFLHAETGQLIDHYSVPTSLQMDGNCYPLDQIGGMLCNPGLFRVAESNPGIAVELLVKAKNSGYDLARRLGDGDIDQGLVQRLFAKDSFNTFSGLVRFQAIYPSFYLSLVPRQVAVAAKINNPSLPELSAWGVEHSVLTVGTGQKAFLDNGLWDIYWGLNLSYLKRSVYQIDASVVDIALQAKDRYLQKNTSNGIELNAGLYAKSLDQRLPNLGIVVQRVPLTQEGNRDFMLDSSLSASEIVEYRSKIQLDYLISLVYGVLGFHQNLPFEGTYKIAAIEKAATSVSYKIGDFEMFLSHTALTDGFGFQFKSGLYELGMRQLTEAQASQFDPRRREQLLLFFTGYM